MWPPAASEDPDPSSVTGRPARTGLGDTVNWAAGSLRSRRKLPSADCDWLPSESRVMTRHLCRPSASAAVWYVRTLGDWCSASALPSISTSYSVTAVVASVASDHIRSGVAVVRSAPSAGAVRLGVVGAV